MMSVWCVFSPILPPPPILGSLAATVHDAGVVETVSASLPLATSKVEVDVLPESGDLVEGLESRM